MTRLQDIVQSFINIIQRKRIGVGHIGYLINRVLNPKLIYVAQLMTLNENDWDLIFKPILGMTKRLLSLPSSFPTSAILHEGIGGIEHPWSSICKKQVTDLLLHLNDSSIAHEITIIRLHRVQINQMMTSPIFKAEKETLAVLRSEKSRNLSLHALTIAKSMNIELRMDTFKEEE